MTRLKQTAASRWLLVRSQRIDEYQNTKGRVTSPHTSLQLFCMAKHSSPQTWIPSLNVKPGNWQRTLF